ncbi:hypothetical protein IKE79_00525 [Candidatus Saccharibacteria bacterium]|nr:hypothetical protein [Candidatus Saccharibacteria bacterium]
MPKIIHTNIKRKLTYILASIPILSSFIPATSVFADPISRTEGFNFSVTVNDLPTLEITMPTSFNMEFDLDYATLTSKVSPIDIKVSTSNETGYELYMTTNQPSLTANFSLSNNDVPTIETLSNTTTGYTENEFKSQVNKWGYTLLSTNLTSSDTAAVGKYLGLKDNSILGDRPDSNYMILNHYNYEAKDNLTTIGFALNLNAHQPAGTYNTTLNFIAITNTPNPECPIYSICYNSNGALTTTSNMNAEPIASTTTNNVTTYQDTTLWASNFKNPDGWGFAGWSTTPNATSSTEYYGPNETIAYSKLSTMTNLAANGITLYANWIKTAGELQGWTGCSALADGAVTALTDNRDNNTYAVAKLADGKCWMIENLRLGNYKTDSTTPTETLSYQNTNVPEDWLGMKANYSDENYIQSLSPSSTSNWCADADQASCYNQSRLNSDNTTSPVNSLTDPASQNVYGYGNYYNWYSATAGYGTQEDGTQNADESYSLCPTSWRLPSGGRAYAAGTTTSSIVNRNVGVNRTASGTYIGFSDFYNLGYILMNSNTAVNNGTGTTAYMSNAGGGLSYYGTNTTSTNTNSKFTGKIGTAVFRSWPNNFLFSGYQYGASTNNRGAGGFYWSSTATSTQYADALCFRTLDASPGTSSSDKHDGFSVRCVTGS